MDTCPEGVTPPRNPEMVMEELAKMVAGIWREIVRVLMADVAIEDCRMCFIFHPVATDLISPSNSVRHGESMYRGRAL